MRKPCLRAVKPTRTTCSLQPGTTGFHEPEKSGRVINWGLAVILAVLNGILFGLLVWNDKGPELVNQMPFLFLTAGPSTSLAIITYLYFTQKDPAKARLLLILGGVMAAALLYVNLIVPNMKPIWGEQASGQMVLHFILFAWCAIGLFMVGFRRSQDGQADQGQQRFAFLVKSLEVFTVSGLALIAGGIFFAVSLGLFSTLNVTIPDQLARFFAIGGIGIIPVLAAAWVYDPMLSPAQQDFQQGISRILATLARILVVPTLLVGLAYVVLIPFNFMAPFENRDVLIAYNAMLFAVLGLLLGATPIRLNELSERTQKLLRSGIMTIAGLAVIVSVYALAAILYRTVAQRVDNQPPGGHRLEPDQHIYPRAVDRSAGPKSQGCSLLGRPCETDLWDCIGLLCGLDGCGDRGCAPDLFLLLNHHDLKTAPG